MYVCIWLYTYYIHAHPSKAVSDALRPPCYGMCLFPRPPPEKAVAQEEAVARQEADAQEGAVARWEADARVSPNPRFGQLRGPGAFGLWV